MAFNLGDGIVRPVEEDGGQSVIDTYNKYYTDDGKVDVELAQDATDFKSPSESFINPYKIGEGNPGLDFGREHNLDLLIYKKMKSLVREDEGEKIITPGIAKSLNPEIEITENISMNEFLYRSNELKEYMEKAERFDEATTINEPMDVFKSGLNWATMMVGSYGLSSIAADMAVGSAIGATAGALGGPLGAGVGAAIGAVAKPLHKLYTKIKKVRASVVIADKVRRAKALSRLRKFNKMVPSKTDLALKAKQAKKFWESKPSKFVRRMTQAGTGNALEELGVYHMNKARHVQGDLQADLAVAFAAPFALGGLIAAATKGGKAAAKAVGFKKEDMAMGLSVKLKDGSMANISRDAKGTIVKSKDKMFRIVDGKRVEIDSKTRVPVDVKKRRELAKRAQKAVAKRAEKVNDVIKKINKVVKESETKGEEWKDKKLTEIDERWSEDKLIEASEDFTNESYGKNTVVDKDHDTLTKAYSDDEIRLFTEKLAKFDRDVIARNLKHAKDSKNFKKEYLHESDEFEEIVVPPLKTGDTELLGLKYNVEKALKTGYGMTAEGDGFDFVRDGLSSAEFDPIIVGDRVFTYRGFVDYMGADNFTLYNKRGLSPKQARFYQGITMPDPKKRVSKKVYKKDKITGEIKRDTEITYEDIDYDKADPSIMRYLYAEHKLRENLPEDFRARIEQEEAKRGLKEVTKDNLFKSDTIGDIQPDQLTEKGIKKHKTVWKEWNRNLNHTNKWLDSKIGDIDGDIKKPSKTPFLLENLEVKVANLYRYSQTGWYSLFATRLKPETRQVGLTAVLKSMIEHKDPRSIKEIFSFMDTHQKFATRFNKMFGKDHVMTPEDVVDFFLTGEAKLHDTAKETMKAYRIVVNDQGVANIKFKVGESKPHTGIEFEELKAGEKTPEKTSIVYDSRHDVVIYDKTVFTRNTLLTQKVKDFIAAFPNHLQNIRAGKIRANLNELTLTLRDVGEHTLNELRAGRLKADEVLRGDLARIIKDGYVVTRLVNEGISDEVMFKALKEVVDKKLSLEQHLIITQGIDNLNNTGWGELYKVFKPADIEANMTALATGLLKNNIAVDLQTLLPRLYGDGKTFKAEIDRYKADNHMDHITKKLPKSHIGKILGVTPKNLIKYMEDNRIVQPSPDKNNWTTEAISYKADPRYEADGAKAIDKPKDVETIVNDSLEATRLEDTPRGRSVNEQLKVIDKVMKEFEECKKG